MSRNQGLIAGVVFVVAAMLLIALLYRPVEALPDEPVPAPAADPKTPTPTPVAAPEPEPEPEPEVPEPVAEPAPAPEDPPPPLTPDVKKAFNYAMDAAVTDAEQICLQPWADQEGPDKPTTMVMDAVVTDGELTDVRVRAIGDVPGDVIDCARDAAWKVDWPVIERKGELSFQRSFSVGPEH